MSSDDLEVQRTLGRIEGAQDQILSELKGISDRLTAHVVSDDKRFSRLDAEANRAKGAGWVILGLLTSFASFIGAAVIAAVTGFLKFH